MTKPLELKGDLQGSGLRVGIIVARFNESVTSRLLEGAQNGLLEHGVRAKDVTVLWVPGSFEVPLAAQRLAQTGTFDAIICLGAIIHHETDHDRYLAQAVSQNLAAMAREVNIPVALGILTTATEQQALDRAGGSQGNRGYDAALTTIELADLMRKIAGMDRS